MPIHTAGFDVGSQKGRTCSTALALWMPLQSAVACIGTSSGSGLSLAELTTR